MTPSVTMAGICFERASRPAPLDPPATPAHGRLSVGELAERLEVSRRAVFRDLNTFSGAGVPVASDRGPHGGAYLLDGYRTDLTGLTEPELEALLAFGGQGRAADLSLGAELDQASRELAAVAGGRRSGRLKERVLFDGATWFRSASVPSHLTRVQDALRSNRRLQLHYRRDVDRVAGCRIALESGSLVTRIRPQLLNAATYGRLQPDFEGELRLAAYRNRKPLIPRCAGGRHFPKGQPQKRNAAGEQDDTPNPRTLPTRFLIYQPRRGRNRMMARARISRRMGSLIS